MDSKWGPEGGRDVLQLITAIVKPHRLQAVKAALTDVGVRGLTVSEARGFGRQGGHSETYRGTEYVIEFVPKVKIEVLCAPEDADRVRAAIASSAHTGKIGDGKIWSAPIDRATRIRTGEVGNEAV
jgi:nitrogen regulatory protein P-II 1